VGVHLLDVVLQHLNSIIISTTFWFDASLDGVADIVDKGGVAF
jgi:hypothetical protein